MISSLTATFNMQNAFDGIAESGQKQWKKRFLWCFTTRVINCIFCHLLERSVTFPDAHSIIYCNLYSTISMQFIFLLGHCNPALVFAIDSSISGLLHNTHKKKTSLYSKLLLMQFFLSVLHPLLCFYIFGKHTFTCASTSPIFVYTVFLEAFFLCTFALDANSFF